MNKINKNNAFTMAEIIITIGIIGVVSAMTLPTLINSYNEHVTVTKVKKMYSVLSQAHRMNKSQLEIPLGNTQATSDVAAKEIADIFIPYLKVAKDCGTNQKGCLYDGDYKEFNGKGRASYEYGGSSAYRLLLNDGSSLWFRRIISLESRAFFDVNGAKPPNRYGYDVFQFQITENEVIPTGQNTDDCGNPDDLGFGCTGYIIKNGNMNYLHTK